MRMTKKTGFCKQSLRLKGLFGHITAIQRFDLPQVITANIIMRRRFHLQMHASAFNHEVAVGFLSFAFDPERHR